METRLLEKAKFKLGSEPNAWQAWFDDSDFNEVSLPHDWSVHMPFSKDYSSGTGYLAGGEGWYRIHISPEESFKGKKLSLVFDGIYKNSRVWCNSYYLGERPNGYISFSYDITDFFHFDDENIISVYVDRREIADSRWFTGSGITRKVTLKIEEQTHPKYNGIAFETPEVYEGVAICRIKSEWEVAASNKARAIFKIKDKEGNVWDETEPLEIKPYFETALKLVNPHLWSPKEPYLYTLETYTVDENEKMVLADSTKVGIREFHFDPDEGFFLNGKSYKFKGVCLHHDAGVLGAAVLKEVWARRLIKLKDMGCNAIRMSHNPHMPELYELCDEMGFFVMDEAFDEWEGPKNKWSTGHNVYPPKHEGYYVNFHTWAKQDLTGWLMLATIQS